MSTRQSIFRIVSAITIAASISFLLSSHGDGVGPPPPTVLSVSPEDNFANVSVKTSISVTFSQAMNIASAEDAFSMNPNVTGTFSWDSGNTVMTFTPSSDLAVAIQQYTCTAGKAAQDIAGNALSSQYQWRWTTWSYNMKKLITDSNYDNGYSITTDLSGNTYLAGMFDGTTDFGAYFETPDPNTSSGSSDIFVTKIDADGTYAWTKQIGGSGVDFANSINTNTSGDIYLTGMFEGTVDFGADFGTSDINTSYGSSDSFLTKINADGTYAWTEQNYNSENLLNEAMSNGSTYRHIYNGSSYSIQFEADTDAGNVYFLNCPNGEVKNGPCTLPPNSTLEYQFTRTEGASIGSIDVKIKDCADPVCCKFSIGYESHWGMGGFGFGNPGIGCYISPVVGFIFNEPAELDIKTGNSQGGCSFYPPGACSIS